MKKGTGTSPRTVDDNWGRKPLKGGSGQGYKGGGEIFNGGDKV